MMESCLLPHQLYFLQSLLSLHSSWQSLNNNKINIAKLPDYLEANAPSWTNYILDPDR